MKLEFSKMHALGNDFVVLDGTAQNLNLSAQQLRYLGDRHFGVGCDQLLLIEPPIGEKAAFRFRFFNADGQEAEQCGNGMRCLVHFAQNQGLTEDKDYWVEVGNNLLQVENLGEVVRVDMGIPQFEPKYIPFLSDDRRLSYKFSIGGEPFEAGVVSMGNPHCVLQVEQLAQTPVEIWGPEIQEDRRFPQGVNVGFMQILTPAMIQLRVYERGVGETLACGSGACAAVAIGIKQGLLENRVTVQLSAGEMIIDWSGGETAHLLMTGPTTHVYKGSIEL